MDCAVVSRWVHFGPCACYPGGLRELLLGTVDFVFQGPWIFSPGDRGFFSPATVDLSPGDRGFFSQGLWIFSAGTVDFLPGTVDFSPWAVDFLPGTVDFSPGTVDFSARDVPG